MARRLPALSVKRAVTLGPTAAHASDLATAGRVPSSLHLRRMPRSRSNRSARQPASGGRPSRGVHVVDVAVIFAELERAGTAQADIARQYRKSAGYVSVLCRLGQALRTLPLDERSALRVRQVTFKAAQSVVSRHRRSDAILGALRTLAAAAPGPRLRRTAGGTGVWREPVTPRPDEAPLDPLPLSPADAAARAAAFVFPWDAAAAARDPGAVLASFEAFVRTATDEVVERLRRAAETLPVDSSRLTSRREVGLPTPSAPAADHHTVALDLSIRQLNDRVAAMLRAHREKMTEFLADRDARRVGPRPASSARRPTLDQAAREPVAGEPAAAPVWRMQVPVSPEEIEADLDEP